MTDRLYLKLNDSGLMRNDLPTEELKKEYDMIVESEMMIESLDKKLFELEPLDRQKFTQGKSYTRIGRACWYAKLEHIYGIIVNSER